MIKVIVIENFTLGRFNELKNIERASTIRNQEGHLYVNDKFECTEEMFKYLTEDNKQKKAFVKIVEVTPKKTVKSEEITNKELETEKPKRRTKKSVAKK